jgi:phosphomannomutase
MRSLHYSGEWVVFTGNQIGTILGGATLERVKLSGEPTDKLAMLASTVSSKFLAKLAEVNGFLFEETLTGFKWIGNRAQELEDKGYNAIFAFEEAIGFTVGKVVRDKDGVSALGFFAEWAVHLHNRGQTANDYLESLYKEYGYFVTDNSYFICHDPQTIKRIFVRMRFGDHPVRIIL